MHSPETAMAEHEAFSSDPNRLPQRDAEGANNEISYVLNSFFRSRAPHTHARRRASAAIPGYKHPMWTLTHLACAPHIDLGEIRVQRASEPVHAALVASTDRRAVTLVRIGLGSVDDAIGREGTAIAIATAVASTGVTFRVEPGATYVWCEGADCAERLTTLVTAPIAVPSTTPAPIDALDTAWRAWAFDAHPFGRPTWRRSTFPTLSLPELTSTHRRYFVRENVVAATTDPAAMAELEGALSALPSALSPDRTQLHPRKLRGPRVATIAGEAQWQLGQALQEPPPAEDAEALWVFGFALGDVGERPTEAAPWFAARGHGDWRAAWRNALTPPTDPVLADALSRARATVDDDLRLRWAVDDLAARRAPRDPALVAPTPDAIRSAISQRLTPSTWTAAVTAPDPEQERRLFLEDATRWFVLPDIEPPAAVTVRAEELSR
jgi:hypothetical protein